MEKLIKSENKTNLLYVISVLSLLCYIYLSYFVERENFNTMLVCYSLLFACFSFMMHYFENRYFKQLLIIAFIYRIALIMQTPNLSNDFYRFIFDGRLIFNGYNPFLYIPNKFISAHEIANGKELVEGMGTLNASHYSCYPSIKQLVFFIAASFSQKNIFSASIIMRIILILADFGTIFFGLKILKILNLSRKNILLYALNPFIILELTGNLHFEGLMVFFLAICIYFLFISKNKFSAFALSSAVMVKLIPLIFIPSILIYILQNKFSSIKTNQLNLKLFWSSIKPALVYCSLIFIGILILLAPFLSENLILNFLDSVNLYFTKFEFNASIYYIIRSIGFYIKGYNIIHIVGKILPLVVLSSIVLISILRENKDKSILLRSLFFSNLIYLLLSTTVHPWYLVTPLFLSIFTPYKFLTVWTYTVFLSYKAYTQFPYFENLNLVALEYTIVFLIFIYEFYLLKKDKIALETK